VLRDARKPDAVYLLDVEASLHLVGRDTRLQGRPLRLAATLPPAVDALQARAAHEALYVLPGDVNPVVDSQLGVNPGRAVHPA
jgi:hypothetical protein